VKLNSEKQDMKTLRFFSEQYHSKSIIVGLEGKKKGSYAWEMIEELGGI